MKYRLELPDKERLLELFEYKDGMLFHIKSKSFFGKRAGMINPYGYRVVRADGRKYYEHRIIWKMLKGDLCGKDIDHINGIRNDNNIENLRIVDRQANNQNLTKASLNNVTGFLGVSPKFGKFCAQIRVDGKQKHLGLFKTASEAHEVYLKAKRQYHVGCTI
jgi:hypothetical protein